MVTKYFGAHKAVENLGKSYFIFLTLAQRISFNESNQKSKVGFFFSNFLKPFCEEIHPKCGKEKKNNSRKKFVWTDQSERCPPFCPSAFISAAIYSPALKLTYSNFLHILHKNNNYYYYHWTSSMYNTLMVC